MTQKKKPTSWRCRTPKQQKDKAEIYNSREWKELRILKLRANPLCEVCEREGIVTAAHAVHHRHPIEDSSSKAEMRKGQAEARAMEGRTDATLHAEHRRP